MAIQVSQPTRQQGTTSGGGKNPLSSGLGLVGTVAGGILGSAAGPGAGTLAGAAAGGSVGQMVGGLIGGGDEQPTYKAPPPQAELVEAAPSDAMSRRMNAIKSSDISNIREGIDSLKYVQNEDARAALARPLLKAEYMARG